MYAFDLTFCVFFPWPLVFAAKLLATGFAFVDCPCGAFGGDWTSSISMLESDDSGFWRLGRLSISDSSSTICTILRFEGSGLTFLGWCWCTGGAGGGFAGEGVCDSRESLLLSIGMSSLEGSGSLSMAALDVPTGVAALGVPTSVAALDHPTCTNSSVTELLAKRSRRLSGFPKVMVVMTGRVESSRAVSYVSLCS